MDNILEKIYKAGLKFLEPLTLEETYRVVALEAKNLVKANSASVFLKQGNNLKRVYSTPPFMLSFKQRKRGFIYEAYKTRKPSITDINKLLKIHPELKTTGIKSSLVIPLSYQRQAVGVLTVLSYKTDYFDAEKVKILSLFASMASLAVRKTQLYERTKVALKNRELFIAMASHELRTPVTTIYGYTQLLSNKMKGRNNAEAKWIKSLHIESHHLSLLIKDLLEIERIKTGKLYFDFKECSLKEIIRMGVENFKFSYPGREIIFENLLGKKSDKVIADFDKLLQVIVNLLDNAAKFSPPNTKITIRLESEFHNLIIKIQDQGKGISKKDLPRIFEGFYKRNDDTTRGMGLGLFLSKSIINKHRGLIKIESLTNNGTAVEISLPIPKL